MYIVTNKENEMNEKITDNEKVQELNERAKQIASAISAEHAELIFKMITDDMGHPDNFAKYFGITAEDKFERTADAWWAYSREYEKYIEFEEEAKDLDALEYAAITERVQISEKDKARANREYDEQQRAAKLYKKQRGDYWYR
jgi:hypothetical protein